MGSAIKFVTSWTKKHLFVGVTLNSKQAIEIGHVRQFGWREEAFNN